MLLNSFSCDRRWGKLRTVSSAAAMLALLLSVGTSLGAPPAEAAAVTFIGSLEKAPESARLAILSDGKDFIAYACSSDDEFNAKYARWIRGKMNTDGSFAGAANDGIKLEGKIEGKNITGKLAGPSTFAFSLTTATEKDGCGLYRSEIPGTEVDAADKEHNYVLGAIVDQKGHAVGSGMKIHRVDPTKKVVIAIVSPRDLVQGKPFHGQINGVGKNFNLFSGHHKLNTVAFPTTIRPSK